MTTNEAFYAYQSAETIRRLIPDPNLSQMWLRVAKACGPLPAVTDQGVTLTYGELDEAVGRFRALLAGYALACGGTVCMLAERSADFLKAFLAAETLGLAVVVMPTYLPPEDIADFAERFGAKLLLVDGANREKALAASARGIPALAIEASSAETAAPCTDFSGSQTAILMFTGGTTGIPKGTKLSHDCAMEGILNGCYGYEPVFQQKYLLVLPLSHVFGLVRSVLTPLYTGSEIVICRDPKKMFEMCLTYSPTIAVLVPLLVERGITLSRQYGRNMFGDRFRYIITGAAPVASHLDRECAALGITLCPGYGLTETACLVSGNPDVLRKPDSVGLLFPNQEVRFVDGELQLRGKNLFSGYTDDVETALAYDDGWFRTGDIARLDEDGFLYILGRKKEMLLLSNGENIYPAVVEQRFNALEEVQECQLYVTADEDGREILALDVLPRAASPEALMERLNEVNCSLPRFQQARKIVIRTEDFPRTASLKMIRYGLQKGE